MNAIVIIPSPLRNLTNGERKVNIEVDSNAERIQKKHIASILNIITPISTKLNIVMQFEIINKPHQAFLERSTELLFSNGKKGIIERRRIAK